MLLAAPSTWCPPGAPSNQPHLHRNLRPSTGLRTYYWFTDVSLGGMLEGFGCILRVLGLSREFEDNGRTTMEKWWGIRGRCRSEQVLLALHSLCESLHLSCPNATEHCGSCACSLNRQPNTQLVGPLCLIQHADHIRFQGVKNLPTEYFTAENCGSEVFYHCETLQSHKATPLPHPHQGPTEHIVEKHETRLATKVVNPQCKNTWDLYQS